jgi:hypothetical protein
VRGYPRLHETAIELSLYRLLFLLFSFAHFLNPAASVYGLV